MPEYQMFDEILVPINLEIAILVAFSSASFAALVTFLQRDRVGNAVHVLLEIGSFTFAWRL